MSLNQESTTEQIPSLTTYLSDQELHAQIMSPTDDFEIQNIDEIQLESSEQELHLEVLQSQENQVNMSNYQIQSESSSIEPPAKLLK